MEVVSECLRDLRYSVCVCVWGWGAGAGGGGTEL